MVRLLTFGLGIVVVLCAVAAGVARGRRLFNRKRWVQDRYQLDPPAGDNGWVWRRLMHRDRGGLIGLCVGDALAMLVAVITNPRGLTSLLSLGLLSCVGWWLGQVASEYARAAVGGHYDVRDFRPPIARAVLWVLRALPFVSVGLGFAYRHELAGICVACAQLLAAVALYAARRRTLHGREFGLTERGVQWARALHADALRIQYDAEVMALGLGTTLLAFYLYEFEVHGRRPTLLPLLAVGGSLALTCAAFLIGRTFPGWVRRHALSDEPVGY